MVLFVALNIFLSIACTYCYLFANSVTDGNVCTKKFFFFYSAELTINVHVNGRHILVFCKNESFEQQVNE